MMMYLRIPITCLGAPELSVVSGELCQPRHSAPAWARSSCIGPTEPTGRLIRQPSAERVVGGSPQRPPVLPCAVVLAATIVGAGDRIVLAFLPAMVVGWLIAWFGPMLAVTTGSCRGHRRGCWSWRPRSA